LSLHSHHRSINTVPRSPREVTTEANQLPSPEQAFYKSPVCKSSLESAEQEIVHRGLTDDHSELLPQLPRELAARTQLAVTRCSKRPRDVTHVIFTFRCEQTSKRSTAPVGGLQPRPSLERIITNCQPASVPPLFVITRVDR